MNIIDCLLFICSELFGLIIVAVWLTLSRYISWWVLCQRLCSTIDYWSA